MAKFLEENELFVPEDDEDEDWTDIFWTVAQLINKNIFQVMMRGYFISIIDQDKRHIAGLQKTN